ncbi:MAG: hypothetical protein WBX15_18750 [Thermoanaerobaculia bacterium]
MQPPVDREELVTWLEGLEAANARQKRSVATMTPEEKLSRIGRLMRSASLFDLSRRAEGDRRVREIWRQLRSRMEKL